MMWRRGEAAAALQRFNLFLLANAALQSWRAVVSALRHPLLAAGLWPGCLGSLLLPCCAASPSELSGAARASLINGWCPPPPPPLSSFLSRSKLHC